MDAENEQRAIDAYNRGVHHVEQGEFDKAIADYTDAIRLNSELATAYYYRGIIYRAGGELNKAEADFAKAEALGYKPE